MKSQILVLLAIVLLGTGNAVCVTTFENPPYNGSVTGVALDGQDGWLIPISGSGSQLVWTFTGNSLGLSTLPVVGGMQFAGSMMDGSTPNRAQHNHDFS